MKHTRKLLSVLLAAAAFLGILTSCNSETADPEQPETETTEQTEAETMDDKNLYTIDLTNRKTMPEPAAVYTRGEAYTLVDNTTYNGNKEGIVSGWQLDNRGGTPRTQLEGGYGTLNDISTTEGTAMIREFNVIKAGVLHLETSVRIGGKSFDGVSLEFRDPDGKNICRIVTKNGNWVCEALDETVLLENAAAMDRTFTFDVELDLQDCKVRVSINEQTGHSCKLPDSGMQVAQFRFATDEPSTASVSLGAIRITAGYWVNTDFTHTADGNLPLGWYGEGGEVSGGELKVKAGDVKTGFAPITGTVIAETEFRLPKGMESAFALRYDGEDVVAFTSDTKNFYANGQLVYEEYVKNLWYRVRLEARLEEDLAVIWLNGRKIGEVPLAVSTKWVDEVSLRTPEGAAVCYDEVRVSEKILHDDYVPAPVRPAGEEDYIVGMNICSLWREGTHYGWNCISAYEDAEPVLGWYDEGVPETADWEIKYMVEHGIDFQAFCWYASQSNAPLHNLHLENHLHDGYMYAEYSDAMKYCLIWEAANAARPDNFNAWKNYYVPYMIENYFKDSRYMTIDNQLVLCVFGSDKLKTTLGSEAAVKEIFDYLEEEVQKLGFDGMIYLACGTSSDSLAAMGFDGSYAYNWGTSGYDVEVNKNRMLASASVKSMYTVPTVSVGFNSIPWHGIRYPMMTVEDYETAHLWVRDEYLPQYAAKDTWQEKFVMLSTWNEYGEGTYIMPSAGNGGFGYLDALRKVYTAEEPDEKLNQIPDASQKARINHLYPQHRRLLRKTGYYDVTEHSVLTEIFTIDYRDKTGVSPSRVGNLAYTDEGITGYVDGDTLIVKTGLKIPAADSPYVRVTLAAPKGTACEVFFITDTSPDWAQSKSFQFHSTVDGRNEYVLDMSSKGEWKDTITGLRVDPGQVADGTGDAEKNWFTLTSVEFMSDPSRTLWINEQAVDMQLYKETSFDGQTLIAFDPKIALDYLLNVFYQWDWEHKTLTIHGCDHTLEYRIGWDKYLFDGQEKELGYILYLQDGLPMIPIAQLCRDLGYSCEIVDDEIRIKTSQYDYFAGIHDRIPGQWEFETDGDNEGWHSTHMSLQTVGGTMTAVSVTDHRDPIIQLGKEVNLTAADYGSVEIRCRWSHDGTSADSISIYFTTDTESSMSENLSIKMPLSSTDSAGEWETITVDLTGHEYWKGIIKELRFDAFNAVGTMEIDYLRFLPKED